MWSVKPNAKLRPTMLFGCGITLLAVMAALVEIQDSRMPGGWHQRHSFLGHTSHCQPARQSAGALGQVANPPARARGLLAKLPARPPLTLPLKGCQGTLVHVGIGHLSSIQIVPYLHVSIQK